MSARNAESGRRTATAPNGGGVLVGLEWACGRTGAGGGPVGSAGEGDDSYGALAAARCGRGRHDRGGVGAFGAGAEVTVRPAGSGNSVQPQHACHFEFRNIGQKQERHGQQEQADARIK